MNFSCTLQTMLAARFDTFELDVRSGELRQGARTVRLQDKPLQLLVLLLEHPGKVVTREKICERLWSADTVVEFEHGIGTALKKLRRALNDDAASPRFIETLPRRGYRSDGHVRKIGEILNVRTILEGSILIPLRRFDEAIALLEPVLMADPLSPLPRKTMAEALAMSGRDRKRAIDELQRLLKWNDRFWLANFTLGNIYAQSGMREEAVAAYEKGLRVAAFPPMIGGLASLHAQAGDRAEAERILRGLDVPEQASGRAKGLMFFFLGCSEYDQVADYLEKLIDARDPDVIWLGCHPFLRDLQQHPRLGALLSKMNFPEPTAGYFTDNLKPRLYVD